MVGTKKIVSFMGMAYLQGAELLVLGSVLSALQRLRPLGLGLGVIGSVHSLK